LASSSAKAPRFVERDSVVADQASFQESRYGQAAIISASSRDRVTRAAGSSPEAASDIFRGLHHQGPSMWRIVSGLAGVALAACTVSSRPDLRDTSGAAEVEQAMGRYTTSTISGAVDSTVAMFAPDGQLLEPGMEPFRGQDAIRGFLAPLATQFAVASSSMTTDTIEIYGSRAYQWGRFAQRAGPKADRVNTYKEPEPSPPRLRFQSA
jgi:hypothetical protein